MEGQNQSTIGENEFGQPTAKRQKTTQSEHAESTVKPTVRTESPREAANEFEEGTAGQPIVIDSDSDSAGSRKRKRGGP